jgi:hypothetical protein
LVVVQFSEFGRKIVSSFSMPGVASTTSLSTPVSDLPKKNTAFYFIFIFHPGMVALTGSVNGPFSLYPAEPIGCRLASLGGGVFPSCVRLALPM